MYRIIENLCNERGISISRMCKECGLTRAALTELKMGRTKKLSGSSLERVAEYFGVSADYLLGIESKKEQLTEDDELFEYLEMLRQRPGMRALLKVHKGSTDEEIAANVRFIEELRGMKDD